MDPDFWNATWARGTIRFHHHVAHPLLVAHFAALRLPPGARIFLPLCGKTVDIGWLRARGFRVAGAEANAMAVEQLFDTLGERPDIVAVGALRHFRARDVDIFQGDIFDLTPDLLGRVDAIYDRAALIALPPDMRTRYVAHLVALTARAPQLLLGLTDTAEPDGGPPFQVGEAEIRARYGGTHDVVHIADAADAMGTDQVWHLIPRAGP